MILFPSSQVSALLGIGLLRKNYDIYYFCPTEATHIFAKTIPSDVSIASLRYPNNIELKQILDDSHLIDLLIFPSLGKSLNPY